DLKPANVMVNLNDEPVILDFGLARRTDPNADTRITQTGMPIGSPAYMSPEQVDGDQQKVGIPSDVYSLGVILYELLTGRLPFEGSAASVLGQIMTREPDRPSEYRRDLSVRLENICLQMMSKDPTKRPVTMHAVAAALTEYIDKFARRPPPAPESDDPPQLPVGVQRRQRIEQLVRSGDYAQAEKLMVALSRETDDALQEAAVWAAGELPRLRKTREEVRAGRQEMYNTAVRLMRTHDYEQAVRLLEEYPYDLRTPKMQQLLEQAESCSHEVERLRKDIKTARNRGDNKQLLILLDALLELKPVDRRAKELKEQLTSRSAGPITKVLGNRTPKSIRDLGAGLQWLAIFALVICVCGYPAYQWSANFLSRDPTAAGGGIGNAVSASSSSDGAVPVAGVASEGAMISSGGPVPFPEDASFVNARPLINLNQSGDINGYPCLSSDGLTIWWTREVVGSSLGIYQATRLSVTDQFEGEQLVIPNSRDAAVRGDGLEAYALTYNSRTRPVRLTRDLLTERFGSPEPIVIDIDSDSILKCCTLSEDDRFLTLMSRRGNQSNLFVLTRPDTPSAMNNARQIAVACEGSVAWGQFLDGGTRLLTGEIQVDNRSEERVVVHTGPSDELTFAQFQKVSIDGDTEQNIRAT
ncbi:MAG: serine/threonine protein kinase, partial [Planctomycetaceae bacterium]|nr:serine/threonine protein kinase [Planctomycetaceae bacterium]